MGTIGKCVVESTDSTGSTPIEQPRDKHTAQRKRYGLRLGSIEPRLGKAGVDRSRSAQNKVRTPGGVERTKMCEFENPESSARCDTPSLSHPRLVLVSDPRSKVGIIASETGNTTHVPSKQTIK